MPKLTIVCEKHGCNLQGDARLLAEVKADVDRKLSLLEAEGSEPTGYYLFDTSFMHCPLDTMNYVCQNRWVVSLHIATS